MTGSTYKSIDDLPMALNAEQVGIALGLSRAKAYNLVNSEGFPTLRVGKRLIIPKDAFLRWINENLGKTIWTNKNKQKEDKHEQIFYWEVTGCVGKM